MNFCFHVRPSCCTLTGTGFVYDKDVTQPNKGIYNCDPKNVVDLEKTYQ